MKVLVFFMLRITGLTGARDLWKIFSLRPIQVLLLCDFGLKCNVTVKGADVLFLVSFQIFLKAFFFAGCV